MSRRTKGTRGTAKYQNEAVQRRRERTNHADVRIMLVNIDLG